MFSNDCSLPNSIQPLSESKFVVYFLEFVSCNDFVGRLTGVRAFVKFSRNVLRTMSIAMALWDVFDEWPMCTVKRRRYTMHLRVLISDVV